MRSWQARRIIAETVRATAQEKMDRGHVDPVLRYITDNAESVTVDVEAALIAAHLLDPLQAEDPDYVLDAKLEAVTGGVVNLRAAVADAEAAVRASESAHALRERRGLLPAKPGS